MPLARRSRRRNARWGRWAIGLWVVGELLVAGWVGWKVANAREHGWARTRSKRAGAR